MLTDSLTVQPVSDSMELPLSPDEKQLLAKLQEQNRLLETDSKSLYSVNGVLHSPSAPKVFCFEETLSVWEHVVKEWDEWSKRRVKELKELVRGGIPQQWRAVVWQLLCNSQNVPTQEKYGQLLKMSSPSERLIRRALERMLSEHQFLKGQGGQGLHSLFSVMKAYSLMDQEVGFCQGSAFIAGLLLMQMPEKEAFCVLVMLMRDFRLRELYKPDMAALDLCLYQFAGLVQEELPDLHAHFETHAFRAPVYASSWFLTLFLSSFPPLVALRVFDIFLCEGVEIVFRVGMAILQMNQRELMNRDTEGMAQYLQNNVPQQLESDPNGLITTAYQVKYDPRKLKKLERDFAITREKEMAQREEMRMLHSENKLLKQRLDTLEKRHCEDVVGQLKRELAQTRQREAETQRALKQMAEILCSDTSSAAQLDENSMVHLTEQLISGRLREAESLTELKGLRQRIKHVDEQWQRLRVGQWRVGVSAGELQDELMCVRLRETHTQALLHESRHRLLQLEMQSQIQRKQLDLLEQEARCQTQCLQRLTEQNQRLGEQLQQDTHEQTGSQQQANDLGQKWRTDEQTTISVLQREITALQTQAQRLQAL